MKEKSQLNQAMRGGSQGLFGPFGNGDGTEASQEVGCGGAENWSIKQKSRTLQGGQMREEAG